MLSALLQSLVLMHCPVLMQGLVLTLPVHHHHLMIKHPRHWSW